MLALLFAILVSGGASIPSNGWRTDPDGQIVHIRSGAFCPPVFGGLKRVNFVVPESPPVLGSCGYAGLYRGEVPYNAFIRVRYYSPNYSRNPQREQELLRQHSDTSPFLGVIHSWTRKLPGNVDLEGERWTIRRGNLLIDCEEEGPAQFDKHQVLGFAQGMCRAIQKSPAS